jgi:hypothetical protein
MARTPASIKKAHQLLQPTAALADMLAVPPMSKLLAAVATGREAKLRKQRKNLQAQAARAARVEVCS